MPPTRSLRWRLHGVPMCSCKGSRCATPKVSQLKLYTVSDDSPPHRQLPLLSAENTSAYEDVFCHFRFGRPLITSVTAYSDALALTEERMEKIKNKPAQLSLSESSSHFNVFYSKKGWRGERLSGDLPRLMTNASAETPPCLAATAIK